MSQIYNPYTCNCQATVLKTKTACSKDSTDCLKVCDAMVAAANSIGPCGELGSTDITSLVTLPKSTSGNVVYQIMEHTANLTGVSINANAITYTSNWSNNQSTSFRDAKIVWRVTDGMFSVIATLIIIFKPNGNENVCLHNQKYNPCTGNCDALSSDLELGDGTTSASKATGTGFV